MVLGLSVGFERGAGVPLTHSPIPYLRHTGESLLTGHGGAGAGSGIAGRGKLLLSRLPWSRRLAHAVLSGLLYAYALLLMLAAMTYNPGVFLALVCGYIAGEFAFGTSLAAGGLAAAQTKDSACCD